MRVLLLGASGMLGHDLVGTAPENVTLLPLSRQELDVTNQPALAEAVAHAEPDLIVNAAAYTAVDRAESEPSNAFRVNHEAVVEIGRLAAQHRSRVVHFSTDYVFDGAASMPYSENAAPNPINVYGASKLAGENDLRTTVPAALVIRTQWLFGPHGRSFPRTMLERAMTKAPTRVVMDQVGRPTYTRDLASVTWSLIAKRAQGLIHVANADAASWYDVAREVFSSVRCAELVQPCRSIDYPTQARRPQYTVLDTTLCESTLGTKLRSWRSALKDFLDRRESTE